MVPTTEATTSAAGKASLEDAIRLDSLLTAEEKEALSTIYRSMVMCRKGAGLAAVPSEPQSGAS
jgi:hypothetical protein